MDEEHGNPARPGEGGERAMQLTHTIALAPTGEQERYFRQASGTARWCWNWALAEWNRQYGAGERPTAAGLKKQFNGIKYQQFPWLAAIHRDAHAQPFSHLARAWSRYFTARREGAIPAPDDRAERRRVRRAGVKLAYPPVFKKKGRARDSFYVANDKFSLSGPDDPGGPAIRLPKVGLVRLTERLRFPGKILGATVSRTAHRWSVAIQMEVPDQVARRRRTADGIEGVDLGIKSAVTLANGETIRSPKPLKAALRRVRIRGRRVSRKLEAAKARLGIPKGARLPKGTRLPVSGKRRAASARLARTHARVAHIRADFTHKLTTRLCRENQALGIEDLHVTGMLANHHLARAIIDVGFGEIRRQLSYKAERYGTRIVLVSRWYPSSKTCSVCGTKCADLDLGTRIWRCTGCRTVHDRDQNAAINLQRLATATALPVANRTVTDGALPAHVLVGGGKVTPVRYESPVGPSGREMACVHQCPHS
ncbi:MAG TPA: transposase [Chloroflexota bacterium]|nr:transposase [Chloroflexota bacterium]